MEVYEIVKSIGSGSFGQVYLTRHKREDKLYVIKKIKIKDMPQKDRENTEQEVFDFLYYHFFILNFLPIGGTIKKTASY